MSETLALLLTDVVDSTQRNIELGDEVMARQWAAHDQAARDLVRLWRGKEVGRSDGFLLLFETAADAVGFALAYHRALAGLDIALKARVGVHVGPVTLRSNSAVDTAQGATPFEIDGVALPAAARVMSTAMGGQTLLSAAALLALGPSTLRTHSHGHWRLKGLAEPMELFEIGDDDAPFIPPPDSPKTYRVVASGNHWLPARALPNNLPAERDAFIGRHDALRALAKHFDGGARLVTLLGIGGIGKTRLSLCHARSWLGDYPGGAWFCDLSSATSSDGIVHAVAQGLDVPLGKADAVQQLGAAIKGRGPCLVILDNFEQVARHAEETLGVWLERAPEARFIATSREVLGIVGEQALVLAPLDTAEAVEMFRQRVRAVGVTSEFGDDDESALVPLVDLLDRLPLAIELAAARGRVMSPRVLLHRMGERFKLLATRGGRRDRQATLRAALDWSWDLLSPIEQSALAQLSVFEGGFTLEAAEAVVDVTALDEAAYVVDVVQALVEKSLVRRGVGQRLNLLRSVQDYAQDRLAHEQAVERAGETVRDATMRRHWRHFSALTEMQATAESCCEIDNLIEACRRAAGVEANCAVGALSGAWAALRLTGPFHVALALVGLVESCGALSNRERMTTDRIMGGALTLLGEANRARAHFQSSVLHARNLGDVGTQSQVLCLLADLETNHGNWQAAQIHLDCAQAIDANSSNPAALLRILNGRGLLHLKQSKLDSAQGHFKAALEHAITLGDLRWQGGLHGNLGTIAQMQGLLADARQHYSSGLAMAIAVGDQQWAGNTHCNLGLLLHELGDDAQAQTELEAAVKIARSIGHRRLEATAKCNLGIVREHLGLAMLAIASYTAAVEVAGALVDPRLEAQFRGYLGLALARYGRAYDSSNCLDLARELLSGYDDPYSLGMVYVQQAMAAVHNGNMPTARASLACAEDLTRPLAISTQSELGQAMKVARQLVRS